MHFVVSLRNGLYLSSGRPYSSKGVKLDEARVFTRKQAAGTAADAYVSHHRRLSSKDVEYVIVPVQLGLYTSD